MLPEAAARLKIDALLVAGGWAIQDYKAFNPSAARGIALREVPLDSGRCDYLLLVDRIPLGVIEAKKEGTTLSSVSDQSAHYGENLPDFLANLLPDSKRIPFAYESTGVETLFRDERDPDPRSRRVFAFHRPETLATWLAEPDTLRARLAALPTSFPLPPTHLRACQIEAITSLEKSFAADRPRALVQTDVAPGKIVQTSSSQSHASGKRAVSSVEPTRDSIPQTLSAKSANSKKRQTPSGESIRVRNVRSMKACCLGIRYNVT